MKRMVMCLAIGLAMALSTDAFAANPRATTDELPAALKSLQPNATKVLTSQQAQRIRGEGGRKFGPHHPAVKFPGNKYTGNRTGQNLKPGYGGLK